MLFSAKYTRNPGKDAGSSQQRTLTGAKRKVCDIGTRGTAQRYQGISSSSQPQKKATQAPQRNTGWPREAPSFHGSSGCPSTVSRRAWYHWQGGLVGISAKSGGQEELSPSSLGLKLLHQETQHGNGWWHQQKGTHHNQQPGVRNLLFPWSWGCPPPPRDPRHLD